MGAVGANKEASPGGVGTQLTAALQFLDPKIRIVGFFLVVVDGVFGASIFGASAFLHLSSTEFVVAVVVFGVVLLGSLLVICYLQPREHGMPMPLIASGGTPSSEVLDGLVNSTLQAICRATSLPLAPDVAGVRAFIFKVEGDQLVCRYYWALNPTSEKVDITRFPLTPEAATRIAVVECALKDRIVRKAVSPLPRDLETAHSIDPELRFVLAAPIHDRTQKVWGTVDFDTSNQIGEERLSTPLADAAVFQLTQHLQVILSFQSSRSTGPELPAEV